MGNQRCSRRSLNINPSVSLDFEIAKIPAKFIHADKYLIDPSLPGSEGTPGDQGINGGLLPLQTGFHIAVTAVAHPPRHSQVGRDPPGLLAIGNPLDKSLYENIFSYRHNVPLK